MMIKPTGLFIIGLLMFASSYLVKAEILTVNPLFNNIIPNVIYPLVEIKPIPPEYQQYPIEKDIDLKSCEIYVYPSIENTDNLYDNDLNTYVSVTIPQGDWGQVNIIKYDLGEDMYILLGIKMNFVNYYGYYISYSGIEISDYVWRDYYIKPIKTRYITIYTYRSSWMDTQYQICEIWAKKLNITPIKVVDEGYNPIENAYVIGYKYYSNCWQSSTPSLTNENGLADMDINYRNRWVAVKEGYTPYYAYSSKDNLAVLKYIQLKQSYPIFVTIKGGEFSIEFKGNIDTDLNLSLKIENMGVIYRYGSDAYYINTDSRNINILKNRDVFVNKIGDSSYNIIMISDFIGYYWYENNYLNITITYKTENNKLIYVGVMNLSYPHSISLSFNGDAYIENDNLYINVNAYGITINIITSADLVKPYTYAIPIAGNVLRYGGLLFMIAGGLGMVFVKSKEEMER